MRHLANAQYWDRPAGGNTGRLFLAFGGRSAPTGLAIVHWIGCINAIKYRCKLQTLPIHAANEKVGRDLVFEYF